MDASLLTPILAPVWLSLKLAGSTTIILLLIVLPLAWWLVKQNRLTRSSITTLATLPLVLPPSVLGFYLLILLGSNGPLQPLYTMLNIPTLAFSFGGLLIASIIYSFPFVLHPIFNAFDNINKEALEAAETLGASPLDVFVSIALPLAKPGILSALVLGFAHTMGEFGVILMIGGSIPDETRVASIALYEHVEAFNFEQAHILAAGLLVFSFIVLFSMYWLNGKKASVGSMLPTASVKRNAGP